MANTDYNKEKYYTVTLRLPKSATDKLKALAKTERRSMNNLIIHAVEKIYNVNLYDE